MSEPQIESAVLRLAGEFDAKLMADGLRLAVCQSFQMGENRFGRTVDQHSANFLVAEKSTIVAACVLLTNAANGLSVELRDVWQKIEKTLDCAVHVRENEVAKSVQIDTDTMAQLNSINVAIGFSYYRVSG